MYKYIIHILFIGLILAQFENVPEDENIILLVGPDNYYASSLNEFVDFHAEFANSAGSRDHFFIVINNYNDNLYQAQLPDEMLISATVNDIWVRDFGIQNLQGINHKFDYSPDYLDNWTSNWIDNSFINFFNNTDLEYTNHNIVLDGGNFQTNGIDKAVITTRIFSDNPNLSEIQIRNYFNTNLGINEIAFIPEDIGDPVGHSDGYVIWLTPTKLAVNDSEEPYHTQIYNVLESSLSGVEYIDMPFAPDNGGGADGFGSAKGIYVNSLQTTDNFYVPIFGIPEDALALAVYEEHTNKNVIPIDAAEVSNWGGSVHCLAMEILRAEALDDECVDGEINNDNPCNPMECWDGQWYEIIIDCAEQEGIPCEGGVYVPPEEGECCSVCVLLGDINQDGFVDILDAIEVVNLVLNGEYNELVDMNYDGTINILDIIDIIYIILN